jgi:hypothetical protein
MGCSQSNPEQSRAGRQANPSATRRNGETLREVKSIGLEHWIVSAISATDNPQTKDELKILQNTLGYLGSNVFGQS